MFKLMGTVLTTKRASQEEIEKIPPFLFRRWLSNDSRLIFPINFFNIHSKVPVDVQYDTIQTAFGGKINFVKFPKKLKDDSPQIEKISKYYNVSLEKARDLLEFLSQDDIKNIEHELQDLNPRKAK